MKTEMFTRDDTQNEMIGLSPEKSTDADNNTTSIIKPLGSFNETCIDMTDEIVQFSNPCPNCQLICETNMKITGKLLFMFSNQYDYHFIILFVCF